MIVRMKHLDLLAVAAEQENTLTALRDLGVMHLDLGRASGAAVTAAKGEAAEAELAVRTILKAREGVPTTVRVATTAAEVNAIAAERASASARLDEVAKEIRTYAPYGDFDPALAQQLLDKGIDLTRVAELPAVLPKRRLSAMEAEKGELETKIAHASETLAAADETSILKRYPELAQKIAFESARELMETKGAVSVISGWIPAPKAAALEAKAKAEGWGYLLRDPAADEMPPTLIEPPKLFRPMIALFQGIGIAPGYNEADVSVPFMCYFSLFFAMLVGDGAYGAIFLAATLALKKKLPRSWFILLTVFSVCTIGWGLLSNTWFGAGIPWCQNWVTVKWLGDATYHNMMFLCFTIGVSHLMLARIWNGVCMLPDLTAIGQFGWAGILLFMYLIVNSIVGIFPGGVPTWGFYVFGAALIAVFGFSIKPSELKARGAELGMLPLNIMSALGDIISYVRLFAVGLASVKVAENFNAMATGMLSSEHSLWLNAIMAVVMVLILVIGHGLNLAMAMLSILVHAVRLNTLEFSNHKGVSWSGYAYRAFAR